MRGRAARQGAVGVNKKPPPSKLFIGDLIGATGAAIYSLRRWYASYRGPAIRVRSADNTRTADIGFTVEGDLDVWTLLNFAAGQSVFITTIYDQSNYALHISHSSTTAHPRIVNNGVLDALNGRPIITQTNSAQGLGRASAIADTTRTTAVWVGQITSAGNRALFSIGSNAASVDGGDISAFPDPAMSPAFGEGGARTPSSGQSFALATPVIITRASTGPLPASGGTPTVTKGWLSGLPMTMLATLTSGFGGWNNVFLGGVTDGTTTPTTGAIGGYFEAIALRALDLTEAQRLLLERNVCDYYGITGYTEAALPANPLTQGGTPLALNTDYINF